MSRAIDKVRIRTFSPDTEGDRHCAFIGSLPMVFWGPTSEAAKAAAEEWRTKEVAKREAAACRKKQ